MTAGPDKSGPGGSSVYFEFTRGGGQFRVAAIDAKTGIAVIVIAPLTATQTQMRKRPLAKLGRRLDSAA